MSIQLAESYMKQHFTWRRFDIYSAVLSGPLHFKCSAASCLRSAAVVMQEIWKDKKCRSPEAGVTTHRHHFLTIICIVDVSLTDWISVKGHWINVHRVTQLQSTLTLANLYCKRTLASGHISMTKTVSLQTLSTWISSSCCLRPSVGGSGFLFSLCCLLPGTSPWATRCRCISTSTSTSSKATWSSTTPLTWPRASWRSWRRGWRPRKTSGSPLLPAAHSADYSLQRWVCSFNHLFQLWI